MRLVFAIQTIFVFFGTFLVDANSTEKITRRQSNIDCPAGSSLCVYFSGESCVDTSVGDVCCADGSGVCSGGFQCGTGVAAALCCQPGSTPEECSQATVVGTATTVPAISDPTSQPGNNNSAGVATPLLRVALAFGLVSMLCVEGIST
ncbi:hypothetical protein A1O3_08969 [Capronia epimyces CBS 606.96]|uniref:Granulins domain-containing protein n=1 Tax=Capronia epimyces CBS 606.96 TaxID=1182542 RepID=W9XG45_9EURO|nr:uncharacterized protein A1O3_08969 [Capronia epimyces CBS 606.96]EXJ79467.1 hypothetical protein A1O3_08969 [Capronia epimyces CBS 606.96]